MGGGLSLCFWSASDTESKNISPNIRYGGVTTLTQNTSSFQEVSPPRQRHLVLMRCYLLAIQVENETIAVRSLLYMHNSKKTKLQLWVGFVSTFWSASDTESKKPKSQLWMQVVSTFWSANDTETKKFKSQLWMGVTTLSPPFDQQMTLSPKILSPNFGWGGCLHLLISKWHWVLKSWVPALDGGCLRLLISKWH